MQRRYSPEQIVGRLRRQFPDDPEMRVSPETIYQSLYVQSRGALRRDLIKCLRTGRALRRPCRQAGKRRNRIPDMINISQRPAEADDRVVPGHWWQRGTSENTNGLLRQYFPKGTDLCAHSALDLDWVATELNDRPRKRLGFAQPIEEIGPLLLR